MNIKRLGGLIGVASTAALCGHAQTMATRLTDVTMDHFNWAPASGSLQWLSAWALDSAVSSFSSTTGFASSYQAATYSPGQPANVTAAINNSSESLFAGGVVNAAGNLVSLRAASAITLPAGVAYDSSFLAANANRDFEITGGVGSVNVTFSFDYSAQLAASSSSALISAYVDFTAGLHLTDGTTTWNLAVYQRRFSPVNYTVAGTASETFTLQYDTAYSLTYVKDNESGVPEPGAAALAAGLGLGAFACHRFRVRSGRDLPLGLKQG